MQIQKYKLTKIHKYKSTQINKYTITRWQKTYCVAVRQEMGPSFASYNTTSMTQIHNYKKQKKFETRNGSLICIWCDCSPSVSHRLVADPCRLRGFYRFSHRTWCRFPAPYFIISDQTKWFASQADNVSSCCDKMQILEKSIPWKFIALKLPVFSPSLKSHFSILSVSSFPGKESLCI